MQAPQGANGQNLKAPLRPAGASLLPAGAPTAVAGAAKLVLLSLSGQEVAAHRQGHFQPQHKVHSKTAWMLTTS